MNTAENIQYYYHYFYFILEIHYLSTKTLERHDFYILFITSIELKLCRVFIKFMSDQTIELWKGYMIAVIFFIVQVMQSMLFQQHYHIMVKISVRIRAAIIDTLYRKTLSVAPSSMASSGTGDFVNFLAIDLQRVQDTLQYIYFVWFAPLNTALSILLLWFQIGWICFVGLAMMGGCILINFLISLVLKRILACHIRMNIVLYSNTVQYMMLSLIMCRR